MRYFLVVLVTAALAAPAFGQRVTPDQGEWELTLSGSGSNDRDFDEGEFSITGDIGQYVTPEILLALRQTVSYVSEGDDNFFASTRLAADYHFDIGHDLVPFIGGNIGYVYGGRVRDTFAGGPEGGIKYYMKDNAFLFARVEYQYFFRSNDLDDRFIYGIGAGFNF